MRRLISLIFIVTVCLFFQLVFPTVGLAQQYETQTLQSGDAPDWMQASFSSLGLTVR